eukprot:TRINITY_DN3034_c1_g1_i1.p1 TRINITY_DN3034_c1_g1~~TRINITY_DN3034_c1_g1_i1.p1  ORF type:complete len:140 (+),score=1.42 TRINITY_DN3034_c1_g1_i1:9-428(+)
MERIANTSQTYFVFYVGAGGKKGVKKSIHFCAKETATTINQKKKQKNTQNFHRPPQTCPLPFPNFYQIFFLPSCGQNCVVHVEFSLKKMELFVTYAVFPPPSISTHTHHFPPKKKNALNLECTAPSDKQKMGEENGGKK